jgi:outer membrane protein OmpA-like peptidoglycan-associated protein
LQIRIEGHADAEGSPEGNQALSERRAEVAVQFLISKGVSADKIKSVGYGATRPVAPNDTPESRALNRRVEIIFSDQ